jgi:hypothetical protein
MCREARQAALRFAGAGKAAVIGPANALGAVLVFEAAR